MKSRGKTTNSGAFAYALAVAGVLFVVAALLQLNDPDPLGWMAVYLAAAGCCAAAWRLPEHRLAPLVVGAIALGWAGLLLPGALAAGGISELASSMKASRPGIELWREALGLLLVAVWMGILVWRATRQRRAG